MGGYVRPICVRFVGLAMLGTTVALVGCGKSGFQTAPVQGKVTCDGQAVPGGSVTLRPLAGGAASGNLGKPASGNVKPDGSFVLGTNGPSDGAVVGKHEVRYSAPAPAPKENMKPGESLPLSPLDGLVPKQKEFEVKPGKNDLNIELVKPTK